MLKKLRKPKVSDVVFLVIIILLIVPTTRVQIQIVVHKGLSYIMPLNPIEKENQVTINYNDWILRSQNEADLKASTLENQVVLINFWATWCPPCIAEMPELNQLYNDYNQKMKFLFITNDNFERVKKFLTNNDYNFEAHQSVNQTPNYLKTSTIPRTLIIDKNGKVIVDKTGALNWNSKKSRKLLDQLIDY